MYFCENRQNKLFEQYTGHSTFTIFAHLKVQKHIKTHRRLFPVTLLRYAALCTVEQLPRKNLVVMNNS